MKRLNVWIVVAIIGILVVLGWFAVKDMRYSSTLSIQIAPVSAAIALDNKIVSSGTLQVTPGKHIVTVSKVGFASETKSVTTTKGKNVYVGIGLIPNAPETQKWYSQHPEDQQVFEQISGKYFDGSSDTLQKTLPLTQYLPFIDQEYRVDYGVSQNPATPKATAIYITYYTPQGKDQALEWIRFKGYDPSKFEIVYVDKSAEGFN